MIDLMIYNDRYKVVLHDDYWAEPEPRAKEKTWHLRIPCKFGFIYRWADDRLAASTTRCIGQRLRKLGRIEADADDGMDISFPVSQLDAVAEIMGARRRRKLSDEQREKLAERGRKLAEKRQQKRGFPAPDSTQAG